MQRELGLPVLFPAGDKQATLTLALTHIGGVQRLTELILRHHFPGFRFLSETGANSFLQRAHLAHTLGMRANLCAAPSLYGPCQVRHTCV